MATKRKHPHVPSPGEKPMLTQGIRVRVKKGRIGYYELRRRREGSVFTIGSEKEFSKVWMERVPDSIEETAPGFDAPQQAIYKGGGAPPQMANNQAI
jgi:hypothetical protein